MTQPVNLTLKSNPEYLKACMGWLRKYMEGVGKSAAAEGERMGFDAQLFCAVGVLMSHMLAMDEENREMNAQLKGGFKEYIDKRRKAVKALDLVIKTTGNINFKGTWSVPAVGQPLGSAHPGDVVLHDGQAWHCNKWTQNTPHDEVVDGVKEWTKVKLLAAVPGA